MITTNIRTSINNVGYGRTYKTTHFDLMTNANGICLGSYRVSEQYDRHGLSHYNVQYGFNYQLSKSFRTKQAAWEFCKTHAKS